VSDGIVNLLHLAARFFESRLGRRLFYAAVAVTFVIFAACVVVRAEFPKRRYVEKLHYESPLEIAARGDTQAKYHSSEFNGFRKQAWGVVMEGMDPYDREQFHIRAYPPFFNLVFMPFALPWRLRGVGSALFYIVSFGLTVLSARWLAGCFSPKGDVRFGRFGLILALLLPLALNVMARCETDMLVMGAVCGALMLHVRRRKDLTAGFLLGCAAAFKVLPGLFGVYLLFGRKWRALGGMVLGGLFCTVLLPALVFGPSRAAALHVSWYRVVVAPYGGEGAGAVIGDAARPSNQSLAAAMQRAFRPIPVKILTGVERPINFLSLSPRSVRLATKALQALVAAMLVGVWIYCRGRGGSGEATAVLFGLVAPGIMLLSDVSLTTHHVLVLVPLSVLVMRMLAGDARVQRYAWLVPLYLLVLVGVGVKPIKAYSPMLFLTLGILVACVAVALGDERRLRGSAVG